MPFGWAAAALSIAGTVMQASAQSQQADAMRAQAVAQQNAANYTAQSMDIQAGQERAVAQRKAINDRRQEQLAISRSQALAAASGGGASDPSVITNENFVTREGELGALTDMYQGNQSGQNLETGATLKRYEGDSSAAGTNAMANATDTASTATLFSGAGKVASLYSKYGSGDTSGLIGYGPGSYSDPSMAPGGINWN